MEHCDCTWDATLTWIDGSAVKSKVILDNGHPFETMSVTGKTGANWTNLQDGQPTSGWTPSPLKPS
jgi:hypothetical protein